MNRLKKKISKRHSRTKRRHRRTVFRGKNAQVGGGDNEYLPTWLTNWYSSATPKEPTATTTVTTTIQPEKTDIPIPSTPATLSESTSVVVSNSPTTPTTPTTVGGGRRYRHRKTKRGKSGYGKKTMKKYRRY